MQRFKNILVFTDSGPRSTVVLERAAALAKRNGAQLTALSVLESLPLELQRLVAAIHPADLWELAVLERQKKLDGLVARSWNSDLNFTTKVLGGSPSVEVIKEVLRRNHDIVLMAAEGEGGVSDLLFGSTSTHLMRECPCPVWVMKSAQFTNDGRVMAAVDPLATDCGYESLNHKIMQLASSLARMERTRLHVLHAWLPVMEPISVFGRLPLSAPELVADARQEHQDALDKLLRESHLDGLGAQVHLVKGEASKVIPRLAQAKQIDLIVMGTVCRAGVPGLLIGNTAEKVLRKVSCSVLTVKPEGFVSPVACEPPRPAEDRDPQPSETAMTQTIPAAGDQQRDRF